MSIALSIANIRETIDKSLQNAPSDRPSVAILGACKGQAGPVIEEAIRHGVVLFGENRVQEAAEKWPDIKIRHPHVQLHLIGPLQTNKVKDALGLFDVIQTLDRPKLAQVLSAEMRVHREKNARHSALCTQHLFIQINTGEEPQKAGIFPKEADAFIRYCRDELKLPVTGLMCIPPADQPPAPHFALLGKIAKRNGLKELSMGMSGDYETAVRMGSTCVRIGTALFGVREGG